MGKLEIEILNLQGTKGADSSNLITKRKQAGCYVKVPSDNYVPYLRSVDLIASYQNGNEGDDMHALDNSEIGDGNKYRSKKNHNSSLLSKCQTVTTNFLVSCNTQTFMQFELW